MEATQDTQAATVNNIYRQAAEMLVSQKRNETEVIEALVSQGVDSETATTVVSDLQVQVATAKKERANKDMLYGALWCVGGIIATAANIGFIFWGAILFGGIQFFKGLFNSMQ